MLCLSVKVLFECMGMCISQYQSVSVSISQYQSVSISISQYQSVSIIKLSIIANIIPPAILFCQLSRFSARYPLVKNFGTRDF